MNPWGILAALLPAVVLVFYIFRRDALQPEPPRWLLVAFGWGVVSAVLASALEIPIADAIGMEPQNLAHAAAIAFLVAAIPEELVKLFCLHRALRKNPCFDEYMDGIVYAVCVGMGFAALENVGYLMGAENWVHVGIMRALLSVPGHFAFAVIMGYYYSQWRLQRDTTSMALMIVGPVMAHGFYDFCLFGMQATPGLSSLLSIMFLFFLHKVRKYCTRLIATQLRRDEEKSAEEDGFDKNYKEISSYDK